MPHSVNIILLGVMVAAIGAVYLVFTMVPPVQFAFQIGGPTPNMSITDVSLTEGDSGTKNFVFTVGRTGNTTGTSAVQFATADGTATAPSDYTAIPLTTLNFAAGQSARTINVIVNGDTAIEANETFFVNLSNCVGCTIGDNHGVGTIQNDEVVLTVSTDKALYITGDTVTVSGKLTAPAIDSSILVQVFRPDGQLIRVDPVIPQPNGSYSYAFVIDGPLTSGTYTVKVTYKTTTAQTTFDLSTPGLPALSINDVSQNEGNSGTANFVFTVTRSGNLAGTSSVQFATAPGTATAGTDYVSNSATVNFAVNQPNATLTVDVKGDTTFEPNETFNVNLSSCTGCNIIDGVGLGTIANDDPVPPTTISINNVSLTEGNSSTKDFKFAVTRSGNTTGASSVQFVTADGTATQASDYSAASGIVNFASGETSKTVGVLVNGDTDVESDETFNVNLSSCTGCNITDGQGLGTIVNDDVVPPTISVNDVSQNEGSSSGTTNFDFTVTRSGDTTGTSTVQFATADGTATSPSDYTAIPLTTLTFTEGQTTKTITVVVNRDTIFEPNETFNVNLFSCTGCTITDGVGVGSILNDDYGVTDGAEVVNGTNPLSKDTDSDGLTDAADQCPTIPGSASNNRCPVKEGVVGGEILGTDVTSLFVAGALANASWIFPLAGAAGIIGYVIRRRIVG